MFLHVKETPARWKLGLVTEAVIPINKIQSLMITIVTTIYQVINRVKAAHEACNVCLTLAKNKNSNQNSNISHFKRWGKNYIICKYKNILQNIIKGKYGNYFILNTCFAKHRT